MSFRNACYHILAPASEAHEYKKRSKLFDILLIALIIVNVAAMMLETVPGIPALWQHELHIIEVVSVLIFTVEYILRVYSSASAPPRTSQSNGTSQSNNTSQANRTHQEGASAWQKRWAYIKSPMALVDLMAILPFYLSVFVAFDLRILRVFRVLRILKIGRYSRSMQTLITVLRNESHSLIAAISVLLLFTVIAATCIYYIEHTAQPNVFSSIPASLWWALVTLTTVGYGDAVPVTALGKVFGGLITIMGICFYALPAGILSSSYTTQMQLKRDRFKDTVQSVLDDGKLSEHDIHHLEHVRRLLDLDEEEAKLITRLLQHHHKLDR
ncbi:ion transporter [Alteromonas sp. PRIM-21]|uniref:ion transporter n=1 Tax=Alteromonas sp. PRIM-21 TaxID=1454978 RepID=UPI0022B947B8|nr:ion transporter [Alteromonas sp. PRIM-21]MCZ8530364.1 ion transporter [Alteromonas sp. PRIM-21]